MRFLYGSKRDGAYHLVATFDSEQQLLAYVNWATLENYGPHKGKFEQGSALVGYDTWKRSEALLQNAGDPEAVPHNPTPSML
jgi:hypothetical protein